MMKKISIFLLLIFLVLNFSLYAEDFPLLNLRNKIFTESNLIKALLAKSKDSLLLTTMFDSCLMTISQIDAYFAMLGMIESIKKDSLTEEALNFIENWLREIKNSNNLNIKNIKLMKPVTEPSTKTHLLLLSNYFTELDKLINDELTKILALKLKLKPRR